MNKEEEEEEEERSAGFEASIMLLTKNDKDALCLSKGSHAMEGLSLLATLSDWADGICRRLQAATGSTAGATVCSGEQQWVTAGFRRTIAGCSASQQGLTLVVPMRHCHVLRWYWRVKRQDSVAVQDGNLNIEFLFDLI